MDKIYNKLLIIGILAAIFLIALFGFDYYQKNQQIAGLNDDELLKAPKENIIDYRTQEAANAGKGNNVQGIVIYRYISNREVPAQTYEGLQEDLSKRTPNSQTFLKSVKPVDDKTQINEYVAKFYAGPKWQKSGDKWYQIETATTTKAAFLRQTSLTFLDEVKEFFGRPVMADTFYSGVGSGSVTRSYSSDWSTQHDATDGTSADYGVSAFRSAARGMDGSLLRAFVPINTSDLPDSSVITAATFNNYVSLTMDTNISCGFVTVVQTTQNSETSLTTADYSKCGNIEGIDSSERKDLTFISPNAYLTFTLNSTGISWISKTGYTKLGLRIGCDVLNTDPSGNVEEITFLSYDSANQPYLSVTYESNLANTIKIDGGTIKIDGGKIKIDNLEGATKK